MSGTDTDAFGAPVGPVIDATPARRPEPVTLKGRFGSVERLVAARHGEALWQELEGHDRLWTYMSDGPFADRAAVRCEIPRWSSTRHSSRVVPSANNVAAGLKTEWAAYGHMSAVRIGLA